MSDLISRQDAIDVLGVFTQADALGHTPKQIVEALPSAQPYTEAEIQTMQDLEQAQIEKAFELGREEGRKEAQPEPCEDAVSRTELRHIFEEHCYPVHYDHNSVDVGMTLPGIVEVLNIAPSVTPKRKTGKWMNLQLIPDDITGHTYGECSICGRLRIVDNFCPNCGAKMSGGEKE